MKYVITRYYDDGTATARTSSAKTEITEGKDFDQYCEEIEDADYWAGANLLFDDLDDLDKVTELFDEGKTVDITPYI